MLDTDRVVQSHGHSARREMADVAVEKRERVSISARIASRGIHGRRLFLSFRPVRLALHHAPRLFRPQILIFLSFMVSIIQLIALVKVRFRVLRALSLRAPFSPLQHSLPSLILYDTDTLQLRQSPTTSTAV